MWAFAQLVEKIGCEEVSVDCKATSMKAIQAYKMSDTARETKLAPLECLHTKCPNAKITQDCATHLSCERLAALCFSVFSEGIDYMITTTQKMHRADTFVSKGAPTSAGNQRVYSG